MDWSIVEDEIRQRASNIEERSAALVEFATESLFAIGDEHTKRWITDGGNDRGVDAVVIDDSQKRIHILSTASV